MCLVNPGRIQLLGRDSQKELLEFCTWEVGNGPLCTGPGMRWRGEMWDMICRTEC